MPRQIRWLAISALILLAALLASGCSGGESPAALLFRLAQARPPGGPSPTPTSTLPLPPGSRPSPTPTLPRVPGAPTPTSTLPREPVPAADASPKATVTGNTNVNLRQGPGTAYNILGTAHPGDTLEVLGRNAAASWFKIRTAEDLEAWIWGNLIAFDFDATALEVVAAPPPPVTAGGGATADTSDEPDDGGEPAGDEGPEPHPSAGQPFNVTWFITNAWDNPATNQSYHTVYLNATGGSGFYRYFRGGEQLPGLSFEVVAVTCSNFFATDVRVEDTEGNSMNLVVTFTPFCPTPIGCDGCELWSP